MLLEIVQNLKVLSSVLLVLSSHSSNFLITPRHAHISKVKTLFFKNYEKDITYNTYNRPSEKVCLFRVLRTTRKFVTHMEMSTLLVKDFKLCPLLSSQGH